MAWSVSRGAREAVSLRTDSMLEKGILAKQTNTENYCVVLSIDPPTRCCGWDPCNCTHKKKYYTPMVRVMWQTGTKAGQKTTIMARLLELVK